MAIDTAAKRSSVLGIKLPFRMSLPFPTGSIGAPARQALGGPAYIGIPANNPNPPPANVAIIEGLVMIDLGLTILIGGLSPQLYKGLVKDELNLISRF